MWAPSRPELPGECGRDGGRLGARLPGLEGAAEGAWDAAAEGAAEGAWDGGALGIRDDAIDLAALNGAACGGGGIGVRACWSNSAQFSCC